MPSEPSCSAADFFVLRCAGLPVDALRLPASGPGAQASLEAGLEADREALRQVLRAWVSEAAVREALALASPDLAGRLEPWRRGALDGAAARGVERALLKYLGRMSSRATPFGLFAGVALGTWGAGSRFEVGPWRASRKAVRLDWGVVEGLVARLEREPPVRSRLRYHPNDSLYARGGWHRYLEARDGGGGGRTYHLEAAESTPHLALALAEAGRGRSLEALAARLAERLGVAPAEARRFLEEIVEAQVLRGDLAPPLTGGDPLGHVIAALAGLPEAADSARPLAALERELGEIQAAPLGAHPEGYAAPALAGLDLPAGARDRIQVDLFRPAPGLALAPGIRRALEDGVELLRCLTPAPSEGPLDRFRSAFAERYGSRWMPLLEVLDEEGGLGFDGAPAGDSPLLEGLAFQRPAPAREVTARDRHLLTSLHRWQGARTWDLTDADLAALAPADPPPFPRSFAALAGLSAPDPGALDRGEFQVWMEQYSGPSAARWLGRFAAGDPAMAAALREHLRKEEAARPDAVFAEVIHVPEGRMGNVLVRPVLRDHEIPFLATPGVPPERAILPAELQVTVRGDRVVLAAPRLGREVVPRLSSAHNFHRGPAVYRFLAHLQDQDGRHGGWSWGLLADLPHLPRVVRGRHVLCRARWRIRAEELREALAASPTGAWGAFQALRERLRLPRFVLLTDADNQLRVDLDRVLWVETLHHLVAGRPDFLLTECFPETGEALLAGPEGRFTHELVIPFEGAGTAPPRVAPPPPREAAGTRSFPPGSEWLYLKLYGGPASADRLLAGLEPLIRETGAPGLWDRWHFLRYRDPDPHVRLRFHGAPPTLLGELLPRLHAHLEGARAQGLLGRWQLDTFEPEWERYGGAETFALVEVWFFEDSRRILQRLGEGLSLEDRWRAGLRGVDGIWAALGLDLPARKALAQASREAFRREFGTSGPDPAAIGAAFRARRKDLEAEDRPPEEGFDRGLAALRAAFDRGEVQEARPRVAASLAHMHLNRLFRDQPREQEWVLMEFLARLYDTRLARGRG